MGYIAVELDGSEHTASGHIELDDALAAVQQPRAADEQAFKAAMRVLAAGVVMATTRHEGRPWGLTISSCCSLTLDPPQILISLRSTVVSCSAILAEGRFGVSILGAHQKSLAELGAAVGAVKFVDEYCDGGEHLESPMISDALYHLDCAVGDVYEVGDHTLIVGRVEQAVQRPPRDLELSPLVYFDRAFWNLGEVL